MLSRVRADRNDAGITLVELIVGMSLVTVLGAIALQFFVGTTQQTDRVRAQSQDAADIRVAAERIAGMLRVADTPTGCPGTALARFVVATASRIVFFANVDTTSRTGDAGRTPPVKVDVHLDTDASGSSVLVQDLYRPTTAYTNNYPSPYNYTANYPSSPSSTQVLLSAGVAPAVAFSYVRGVTDGNGVPARCQVTATGGENISAVGVDLTAGTGKDSAKQTVRTVVAITGALS